MNYKQANIKMTDELLKEEVSSGTIERFNRVANIIQRYFDKNRLIFEIGVKRGDLFDVLKKRGFKKFSGIDVSEKAIRLLRAKGYKGWVMDAQSMSRFSDESTPAIIISHCLEHCPEVQQVADDMHRLLKKDGILYVEVPKQKKEPVPTKWAHYYCFDSHNDLMSFFPSDKWNLLYMEMGNPLISVLKKK